MIFTVAIDGPAAAGKGTVARAVAAAFGLRHLDTGLLYRAVGVIAAETGAPAAQVAAGLVAADLARPDLRSAAAGQAASRVAALPEVRAALFAFQRAFARAEGGAVLDGRDIGTVICPEAEAKLFITASAEVRGTRRWRELEAGQAPQSLDEIIADVRARDRRDEERAEAPLRRAPDAVVLDTSELSIDEAVARASAVVAAALARAGAADGPPRR